MEKDINILKISINSGKLLASLFFQLSKVEDVCACQRTLDDSYLVITVPIYISPNQTINTINEFILENVIKYTPEVSRILNEDYDKIPTILSGDFSMNFA